MPSAIVTLSNGKKARLNFPEGTTREQAQAEIDAFLADQESAIQFPQQAAPPASEEIDPMQAALISAGSVPVTVAQMAGVLPPPTDIERQAMGQLRAERPIATAIGEAVPFLPFAMAGGGLPVAGRIATGAATGAAEGGVLSYGRGEDAATGAAIGGLVGAGGESVISGAQALWPRIRSFGAEIIRKVTGKSPTTEVLTSAGQPSAELTDALNTVGGDFTEMVREASENIAGTAKKWTGKESAQESLAQAVKPSQRVVEAAKSLDLKNDLLASHVSTNPAFIVSEQGLKSIPGSQLAIQEKAIIAELADKADQTIVELGGSIDKASLSERFRTESMDLVKKMETEADALYKKLDDAIPANAPASANNTIEAIQRRAQELGGEEYLDQTEKNILRDLAPVTAPTYARLDSIRRDLLAGRKGQGPFKDSDRAKLGRIYGLLLEDQKAIAEEFGARSLYETASQLVASRKFIEDQLETVIGKGVSKDITAKAGPALTDLAKGKTEGLKTLLSNIPEELGPEMRRDVVATALNDVFTTGARTQDQLSVSGFAQYWTKLNRNPGSKALLAKELGPEAMKRLDNIYTVSNAINKAQRESISTGRVLAVPEIMDRTNALVSGLYGTIKGALSPIPGARTVIGAGEAVATRGMTRSQAADKLLASAQFRDIVSKAAAGKLDTEAKRTTAQKVLEKLPEYNRFVKILPKADTARLVDLGVIAYFMGDEAQKVAEAPRQKRKPIAQYSAFPLIQPSTKN